MDVAKDSGLRPSDWYRQCGSESSTRRRVAVSPLSLPDVVMISMMSLLTAIEVCTSSRVCREWHTVAICDHVWRSIVLRQWSHSAAHSARILASPHTPYPIIQSSSSSGTGVIWKAVRGKDIPADWRSRYRQLQRIGQNWKQGVYKESRLIGHTARITVVTTGADLIVR